MSRIVKRPAAQEDIDLLWDYIAEDSPGNADKFIRKLDETFRLLAGNPFLGRERPELAEGLRSFPFGRYLIFYIALNDGIEVIRLIGQQDIPSVSLSDLWN